MSISPKDQKLLWGKAASRCSIPECRKPLIMEDEPMVGLHKLLLGQMAHIVGEKNSSDSARGISILTLEERNCYENLILLCRDHHTMIDERESLWPVEKLHIIKRQHELWIDERLGREISEQEGVYHDFIDRVALALNFEHWEWLCDHLFRTIMPTNFPDGVYQLGFEYFRANLPGKNMEFELSLKNIVERSRVYLDHYMSNAEVAWDNMRIMGIKRYKDLPEHNYHEVDNLVKEYRVWERNCTILLSNLVVAMNEFVTSVRENLRPEFFIRKGQFCLHDFMGLMGGTLTETWHLPKTYFTDADLQKPIDADEEQE